MNRIHYVRQMLCSASIIKHIHFTECFEGDNTVQIPLCQIPLCI